MACVAQFWSDKQRLDAKRVLFNDAESFTDMAVRLGDLSLNLARTYRQSGVGDMELWHCKLGHVSAKKLAKIKIPGLTVDKLFKCDSCIRAKIHRNAHPRLLGGSEAHKPGECLHTDHRGPYARSIAGNRYTQLFVDFYSRYRWGFRMTKKTGSYDALKEVIADCRARSGNALRYIKTDGDGVFTSGVFAEICRAEKVIHVRSAPEDHNTNPIIEREQRTVLEATAAAMFQSGAPAGFWGECENHVIFTMNNTPSRTVTTIKGEELWSPREVLEGSRRPVRYSYLKAFGTACVCYIPPENRIGVKSPSREKSFSAVIMGYASDMDAYRVWDPKAHKIREVSFAFTITIDGSYPFRDRKAREEWQAEPTSFIGDFSRMAPGEFKKYEFDSEDVKELVDRGEEMSRLLDSAPKSILKPSSAASGGGAEASEANTNSEEEEAMGEADSNDSWQSDDWERTMRKAGDRESERSQEWVVSPEFEGDNQTWVDPYRESSEEKRHEELAMRSPRKLAPHRVETIDLTKEENEDSKHDSDDDGSMSTMLMNDGNLRVESTQLKKFLQQAMESGPASDSLSSGPSVAAVEEPVVIHAESAHPMQTRSKTRVVSADLFDAATMPEKPMSILPPKTLGQAQVSPWWRGYEEAIRLEMEALLQNGTWVEVKTGEVPCNTPVLRTKFVFDDKRDQAGNLIKFKARLVAMGFDQVHGVDYFDTYASVMTTRTFRTMLAMWNYDMDLEMFHWDIKTAFINAPIAEEVYCVLPTGYGKEGHVIRLVKALYGTKQAAYAWQQHLCGILIGCGGVRNPKDECIYMFRNEPDDGGWCMVCTHVDDLFPLCNGPGKRLKDKIKAELEKHMTVEDKGELAWALDTRIQRDRFGGVLKISQEAYIKKLGGDYLAPSRKETATPMVPGFTIDEGDLPKSEEEKKKVSSLPVREVVGKLWWVALISRPDIIFATHYAAKWVNRPSEKLWVLLMRIVAYLDSTSHIGLCYKRGINTGEARLSGYVDASFLGEGSKSRYGFFFQWNGCLVAWISQNTSRLVLSSTEAECNGLVQFGKENMWERELHESLNIYEIRRPTWVSHDNQSAIKLTEGIKVQNKRSKHFGLEFDWLREHVALGEMKLSYCDTDNMLADVLTKALPAGKFAMCRDLIMGFEVLQKHFEKSA